MQAIREWNEIFEVLREKNSYTEFFFKSEIILQKWSRNKDSLRQTKTEGICCQYTCLARNVERSSLSRIIYYRSEIWIYINKGRVSRRHKWRQNKHLFFLFLIDLIGNSLFKNLIAIMYLIIYAYVPIRWMTAMIQGMGERNQHYFIIIKYTQYPWSSTVSLENGLGLAVNVYYKL